MTLCLDSKSLESFENSRLGIDLVFLIDSSGSMYGEKMENLKKSLDVLIDILKEKDRVCIINFNSLAQKQCSFIEVITFFYNIFIQNIYLKKKILLKKVF